MGGIPVEPWYGPNRGLNTVRPAPAPPGDFPFTRGIGRTEERDPKRLWGMLSFSGSCAPEQTNRRYRDLVQAGFTSLSLAFDQPTRMGLEAGDPASHGQTGKGGVAVSSLADVEALIEGIPLAKVSVGIEINSLAAPIWAMFLVAAERQGVDLSCVRGTVQNDVLGEAIAGQTPVYPLGPSMRLATDVIEFAVRRTPRFDPVAISGYQIREAGSTAMQEVAFALRGGLEYVDWAIKRGFAVDDFAPRFRFIFDAHSDFFEEVAKYRAARQLWAELLRDRCGAKCESSLKLRFHAQTAESSLTSRQPSNNIIRTALQAMAAVLGGAQSLHTSSTEEASDGSGGDAARLALRTQQVIAHESGITAEPDPFGGSYFVEHLTRELETGARGYIEKIDSLGGMIMAARSGFPQTEIARAREVRRSKVESGEAVVVGVNRFQQPESAAEDSLCAEPSPAGTQGRKLRLLRAQRNNGDVRRSLHALKRAAEGTANLMPLLMDAARACATLGEMSSALRDVFGSYEALPTI